MEGILNVDKPQWLTSHDVVGRIRRASGVRRVGHAGTLDPLATGVLLVCVGRTTRLVEYLMGRPKTYEATVRLGQTTDTYDAEGDVVDERPFAHLTESAIENALDNFRGPIEQLPPLYSAIKVNGQPMYKLARQGKTVARKPRPVTIYGLELLAWEPPNLRLRVDCSTGTYIRSLAYDLGERLGCGGHIIELRRTAVGEFTLAKAVALDAVQPDNWHTHLLPGDRAVQQLPRLDVDEETAVSLLHGRPIPCLPEHPDAPLITVYNTDGQFIGILQREHDAWRPRKMFPPERVAGSE